MIYNVNKIDSFAKALWEEKDIYSVKVDLQKPKFYVLDMFPYPSGAGLHVGHALGSVASDIFARYKVMKGFNVIHPMGFDSFGLPTEQYAIETGIHPTVATSTNIETYKKQIYSIGYNYDWSKEIITSNSEYYKWTQWIFIQMFNSFYCDQCNKAKPIQELIDNFDKNGFSNTNKSKFIINDFSSNDWKNYSEKQQSDILMAFRLAYIDFAEVNWCEELSTVLANDEIVNGVSERGGYPVIKKRMKQWFLRTTVYAQRLLDNLESLDWSFSIKEQQRNWIGKSIGCNIFFNLKDNKNRIEVFTTRADTIFGCTFIVLSPEHPLVSIFLEQKNVIGAIEYIEYSKNKSEIDRQAEKNVSGIFIEQYAIHPFTQKLLPIYISEYVLNGYGTGAIMAVPSEDERDNKFALKFEIPIIEIYNKESENNKSIGDKEGKLINSDFLNSMDYELATKTIIDKIEQENIGFKKIQYRLRDAGFSRQRYWGEPIPVIWKNDIPYVVEENLLPVVAPVIDDFLPTKDGKSPLSRNQQWVNEIEGYTREIDTMPSFAGSSWYFLRYLDNKNSKNFIDSNISNYWKNVDVYVGGSEHSVGHLLYSRFFTNFLFDRGYLSFNEPFQKLINQGMIQGRSNFVYRCISNPSLFISYHQLSNYNNDYSKLHVDISLVDNDILNISKFKNWRKEYHNCQFVLEENQTYVCGVEIEKMSKSKYNVVRPDDIIDIYGADCFRMYEMFLGPIELSKMWNNSGIEGVNKFLKKYWSLIYDKDGQIIIHKDKPTALELKVLHTLLKKLNEDIPKFSFNTCISAFMICVNELTNINCHCFDILVSLNKAICPFAPHIAEFIWKDFEFQNSIIIESYPVFDPTLIEELKFEYPISINGKLRTKIMIDKSYSEQQIEKIVFTNDIVLKWIDDKNIKKIIIVKNRMVNIVC